jgi:hypothetical protein
VIQLPKILQGVKNCQNQGVKIMPSSGGGFIKIMPSF